MAARKVTFLLIFLNLIAASVLLLTYYREPFELEVVPASENSLLPVVQKEATVDHTKTRPSQAPARPLFSRKREEAEKQVGEQPRDLDIEKLAKLILTGIIIDGSEKVAIFLDGKAVTKAHEGDSFGQWKTKLITRKEVIFTSQDKIFVIHLDKADSGVHRPTQPQ